MLLQTNASAVRKARRVNSTATSFQTGLIPTRVTALTNPAALGDAGTATGRAVIALSSTGHPQPGPGTTQVKPAPVGGGPNTLRVSFFGTGADNATLSARLWAWNLLLDDAADPDTNKALWIPVLLWQVQATLSTVVGVAGATVVATERFADTISLTYGNDDISVDIVSPANNITAHLQCDLKGGQFYEFDFITDGSATDCNAFWSAY